MRLSVQALILAASVAAKPTAAGPIEKSTIRQLLIYPVVWTAGKDQARAKCTSTWARYWRYPLAVSEIDELWRRADGKVLIFPFLTITANYTAQVSSKLNAGTHNSQSTDAQICNSLVPIGARKQS
jgi:hypothetical protein